MDKAGLASRSVSNDEPQTRSGSTASLGTQPGGPNNKTPERCIAAIIDVSLARDEPPETLTIYEDDDIAALATAFMSQHGLDPQEVRGALEEHIRASVDEFLQRKRTARECGLHKRLMGPPRCASQPTRRTKWVAEEEETFTHIPVICSVSRVLTARRQDDTSVHSRLFEAGKKSTAAARDPSAHKLALNRRMPKNMEWLRHVHTQGDPAWERLYRQGERRASRLEKARVERTRRIEEQEMAGATFRPRINATTSTASSNRLPQQASKVATSEDRALADCTFRPDLSRGTAKLVKPRTVQQTVQALATVKPRQEGASEYTFKPMVSRRETEEGRRPLGQLVNYLYSSRVKTRIALEEKRHALHSFDPVTGQRLFEPKTCAPPTCAPSGTFESQNDDVYSDDIDEFTFLSPEDCRGGRTDGPMLLGDSASETSITLELSF